MPAASKRREAYLTRGQSYPLPVGDKLQSICTRAGGVSYPEKWGGKQEMFLVSQSLRVASMWVLRPLSWQMKMFGMHLTWSLCVLMCTVVPFYLLQPTFLLTTDVPSYSPQPALYLRQMSARVCIKALPFTLITASLFTYHSRNFLLTTACLSTYDSCTHVQAGRHLLITACLSTYNICTLLLITAVNTCRRKSLPFTHYSIPF